MTWLGLMATKSPDLTAAPPALESALGVVVGVSKQTRGGKQAGKTDSGRQSKGRQARTGKDRQAKAGGQRQACKSRQAKAGR
jgi:hypothetical protein